MESKNLQLIAPDTEVLTNPLVRQDIRPDFPRTIHAHDIGKILKVVRQELLKQGTTLAKVERINIAYPHKHPVLYPGYRDQATNGARRLKERLSEKGYGVYWAVADGICETVHLGRSENQTSIHALMSRQIYDIHKPIQYDPIPFIDAPRQKKEFFIVTDWAIEQGTTIANMINYIEHNGGHVLAAVTESTPSSFTQESSFWHKKASLSSSFNTSARNTARLGQLAYIFSKSARQEGIAWLPEQCLTIFNACLEKHGNSVFALTDGECKRLIDTIRGVDTMGHGHSFYQSFISILKTLDPELDPLSISRENSPAAGLTSPFLSFLTKSISMNVR